MDDSEVLGGPLEPPARCPVVVINEPHQYYEPCPTIHFSMGIQSQDVSQAIAPIVPGFMLVMIFLFVCLIAITTSALTD